MAATQEAGPECPRSNYLETQFLFWRLQLQRYPGFDLGDREFWKRFGYEIPPCGCGQHETPSPNGHKPLKPNTVPVFRLHYSSVDITAPVYAEFRARLSVMLVHETKDMTFLDMELGNPSTEEGHATSPGIESYVGRGAKQVLARLRRFELGR